ncbi:AsmA family protein [Roseivirga pacifica]
MPKQKRMKWWIKTLAIVAGIFVLFLITVLGIAYNQQDRLIQKALSQLNEDFPGRFAIRDSHISPFANFPYVSIDLEDIEIFESKADSSQALVHVQDTYIGFDLISIIKGTYQIKKVKLSDGFVKLIQHTDGSFNVVNALVVPSEEEAPDTSSEALHLSLDAFELVNIDVLKINEANNLLAEVFIENIKSSVSTSDKHIKAQLDSKMLFNLILDGDTSFLHDKHLSLSTGIDYDLTTGLLDMDPSKLMIEQAEFLMDGTIDMTHDMDLDLQFSGQKPNFDMFLAFVPEEYDPLLRRYENGGSVYFDAIIKGPSANGAIPHVEIDFGCAEAFVENVNVSKGVDELFFKGHFTTGEKNTPETMSVVIEDFRARPEEGSFTGNVRIQNFESPDIEMQLRSEFNLDFLIDFFEIPNIEDASGKIVLDMNFHDIVDLDNPTKAIEKLNESYYTEFKVEDLNFKSKDLPLPMRDINIHASMDGHLALVDQFKFKTGNSDLSLVASVSDLPAILHHTATPVEVDLDIRSKLLDIQELTKTPEDTVGFDERIENLSMSFKFNSSARAFTESPNLPLGEFFIKELNAQLTHYPHRLHDFNADIIIDSTDFKVIDFTGMLDQSDFHFNGSLKHYDLWFDENPNGDTEIDFNLTSNRIELDDIFSYGGANYVPEDYRHEVLKDVKIHGLTAMHFKGNQLTTDLAIDKIEAFAQSHNVRLEQFSGNIYLDSAKLKIDNLGGKLGNTELKADLLYHLDSVDAPGPHIFTLRSPRLDFDQLFSYAPPAETTDSASVDHEDGFNIFDLPFSNLEFDLVVDHLNYHRYLIDDFALKGRMQENHYIYIDTMALKAAGGSMALNGYFNGSDPDQIYFSPNMKLENVDLDKLLFKFDNFGQDQLISDNLHGQLSGTLTGRIHMHPDLVPATDVSELDMNIEVVNGRLVEFSAFEALSDYFTDKNLKLVRFDTLKNNLTLKNGSLIIPNMNLNTTLGYFEIAGEQGLDSSIDYTMRIPLKVITKAGVQKLFGNKNRDNSDQVDEIQYRDESKRTTFISLTVTGTPDAYSISLGKKERGN